MSTPPLQSLPHQQPYQPKQQSDWPAMMAGAALLFVGIVLGAALGGVAGFFAGQQYANWGYNWEPEATLSANAPAMVTVGEPFDVTLTLQDTSGAPRTVYSVDLYHDPSHLEFVSIDPPMDPGDPGEGYTELFCDERVEANGSFQATLTLRALRGGETSATLYAYSNEFGTAETRFSVQVTPADPPSGRPSF
ncbi:MAG: cohesin domain-containing protein [Planctomycetota bacterium]